MSIAGFWLISSTCNTFASTAANEATSPVEPSLTTMTIASTYSVFCSPPVYVVVVVATVFTLVSHVVIELVLE